MKKPFALLLFSVLVAASFGPSSGSSVGSSDSSSSSGGVANVAIPTATPVVIEIVNSPKNLQEGQTAEIVWRVSGGFNASHTSVHYGLKSVKNPTSPSDYSYATEYQRGQNTFSGKVNETQKTGVYYYRAHAVVDSTNYWTPEYSFEVTPPKPPGTQNIDPSTILKTDVTLSCGDANANGLDCPEGYACKLEENPGFTCLETGTDGKCRREAVLPRKGVCKEKCGDNLCEPGFECSSYKNRAACVFKESSLNCADKPTSRERIKCRVELETESPSEKLSYVPEECREKKGEERALCFTTYAIVQKCRRLPGREARENCVKKEIRLSTLAEEKFSCKKSSDEASCKEDLKKKVFTLAKFRIYDLEQKAQDLMKKGFDKEKTLDLIALLEEKKQGFDSSSLKEKKQTLLEVKKSWLDFFNQAKEVVKK